MRTTVGLSFFITMKYDKRPIDISQQLQLLQQRGLRILDIDEAVKILNSISYFRLASYWQTFEEHGIESHQFIQGCCFDEVVELYLFDKKLRGLIFSAIQDIEIALRTRIIHCFSLRYGAFWFMDSALFKNETIFNNCLDNINKEVKRSNEIFLKEHFEKYDEPSLPPVWKTMEVVSFGTLSKLFCNFKDVEVKKLVAKSFGLPQYAYLESWMKSISALRNCCAHHGRLWNKRLPFIPQLPTRLPLSWISLKPRQQFKLYAPICCMAYLEQSIKPKSTFTKEIVSLLSNLPTSALKHMGVPLEWEKETLWRL